MNFDIIDDAGNRINILCDFLFSEKKKTKLRYKLLGAITENGNYVTPYQYKNAKWRIYSDSFHSAYSITVKPITENYIIIDIRPSLRVLKLFRKLNQLWQKSQQH